MPGPAPKDPKIRQRRNRAATSAELGAEVNARQRTPSLPKRKDADGEIIPWQPLTREWWRDVWHSPMAKQFLEADKHALFRLAALVDMFWSNPTKELGAEIRLEQQAFGLTPIDRRRLDWEIKKERDSKQRRAWRPSAEGDEQSDPRNVLNWVVAEE